MQLKIRRQNPIKQHIRTSMCGSLQCPKPHFVDSLQAGCHQSPLMLPQAKSLSELHVDVQPPACERTDQAAMRGTVVIRDSFTSIMMEGHRTLLERGNGLDVGIAHGLYRTIRSPFAVPSSLWLQLNPYSRDPNIQRSKP